MCQPITTPKSSKLFWAQHSYHPSGLLAGIRSKRTGEMLEWMDPALQIDYGYDASGRVNSMSLGVPDVDPALPAVGKARMTLHRDAFGRVDEADWEASEDGITWDAVKRTVVGYEVGTSRLVQLSTGAPNPGGSGIVEADVLDYVLAYDRPGRVTSTEETWGTMGQAFKREYGYDGMARLTEVREYVGGAGTWSRKHEYAYDTLGQRISKTLTQDETNPLTVVDTEHAWTTVGTLDKTHEPGNPGVVHDDFTFDNDGNLTALDLEVGDSLAFAYDSSRRLAQITDPVGGKYQYLYGPDEVRVGRDIDETGDGTIDVSHRFFSDGLVTYQFDGFSGDLQFAIVYAPDGYTPVFYVTFVDNVIGEVYFFLNDHLSTPRALVDSDGVVVWKARYEPFGGTGDNQAPDFDGGEVGINKDPDNDGTELHQPLRFPGQWDDGIPGIWYNHHRFYLPEYGMYGRRDPIPRVDGNAYSYVGGNPASAVDPWGLLKVFIWNGHGGNPFGHASLMTEGGTYVSFNSYGDDSGWFSSYDGDVSFYETKNGGIFWQLDGYEDLESFIDSWKETHSVESDSECGEAKLKYDPVDNNCVIIVKKLLALVGIKIQPEGFYYPNVITPGELEDRMRQLFGPPTGKIPVIGGE